MNIKQLQYFVEICKKKNLTIVAKDFYISQQGLSSALKKMEEELGVELFTRSSKGVELNEYAKMILPHVEQAVREYAMVETKIRNKKDSESGQFPLHVNRILLDTLPEGTEAKMLAVYPNIHPEITDISETKALQNIDNEVAELALVSGPVDSSKYARKVLNSYPYIAVVKKGSPLAKKEKIFIRELKEERIMTLSETTNAFYNFVEICMKNGFYPKPYLFASDAMHLLALCSDTDGVGVISTFYGEYFSNDLVKKIPIADKDFFWTIEFAYKKGRVLENHVKLWLELFLQLAKEYFGKQV